MIVERQVCSSQATPHAVRLNHIENPIGKTAKGTISCCAVRRPERLTRNANGWRAVARRNPGNDSTDRGMDVKGLMAIDVVEAQPHVSEPGELCTDLRLSLPLQVVRKEEPYPKANRIIRESTVGTYKTGYLLRRKHGATIDKCQVNPDS